MWLCMSMPPAMTMQPLGVDLLRDGLAGVELDHPAIPHHDVAHLAIHPVHRVVHTGTPDAQCAAHASGSIAARMTRGE